MKDHRLLYERLWSSNIWDSLYFKIRDLLVIKGPKRYCMERRVIKIVLFIKKLY
jgi:hypothetical protein